MKKLMPLLTVAVVVLSTLLLVVPVNANPSTTIIVSIDIKPGSCPNSINLGSRGVLPVAVETTVGWSGFDDFDATTVDPPTVRFADAAPLRWAEEDVNGDGYIDVIFHFKVQELNLDAFSTEATLTGFTLSGDLIEGTSSVNIVPK
jgi:hypothetical protein